MVGHAVIVRGRYCALIKRRKHYERLDIPFANIRGWINHALGTQYTPGKRANIWACIEHDILKKERYDLRRSDLTDLIPYSWCECQRIFEPSGNQYLSH